MIKNSNYLKQSVDFDRLICFGQDLDWWTDFDNDVFLGADFKYGDATLTQGQKITVMHLLQAIGATKPVFFAVVQHEDAAPDPIEAGYGRVRQVFYTWPSLKRIKHHTYDPDDDMSFREWVGTVAVVYFKQRKLNQAKLEQDPWYNYAFMFDDVFASAWDSDEAKASRHKDALWAQKQNIALTGIKDFPLVEVLADSAHLRKHWDQNPFQLI